MTDTIQERPGLSDEDREYCLKRLENGAYYYSFQPTGCAVVDLILGAVSVAGKRYHHTEGWGDDDYGPSCVEVIERAANEAADEIDRLNDDWQRLVLLIANNLDPECADAEWSDIADSFDPWECVRSAADKLDRLERELVAHRKYIESITDNGTDYPDSFDEMLDLGLIVAVPPTPEFIEEWGDADEMLVLACSPLARRALKETAAPSDAEQGGEG